MKTTLELLHEKDAELKELYEIQNDAWKQEARLQVLEKKLDRQIQDLEKGISDLMTIRQEEIWREREGRHE